eukprot:3696820-Pyramimonas_sp.AAC.1
MCITVDSAGSLAPNLQFLLRDAARTARRVLSRPWNAVPRVSGSVDDGRRPQFGRQARAEQQCNHARVQRVRRQFIQR